ncbi:hypothetical protein CEXT_85101 [Caerostris extrusa]|uniref:Transposase n=1 Tax=Caerostris extrusa TaxID=172846 RepID=A0AAV4QWH5_CAEEX|nr:hypothetical protein CEXT_85101 [Caerostris extrusa]
MNTREPFGLKCLNPGMSSTNELKHAPHPADVGTGTTLSRKARESGTVRVVEFHQVRRFDCEWCGADRMKNLYLQENKLIYWHFNIDEGIIDYFK